MAVGELSIYQMVLNRLPFLVDNPTNQQLITDFTLEVAWELESCFQVRFVTDPITGIVTEDDTRVGLDSSYTILQKSIIADLVASYILTMIVVGNTQGNGGTPPSGSTFLKRAKAGSAEVEWGQFSVKDGAVFFIGAGALLDKYKSDAARKARGLGCIIDICDDCTAQTADNMGAMPFITVSDCGCGC